MKITWVKNLLRPNKMRTILLYIFFVLLLLNGGCNKAPQSMGAEEYMKWLDKEENGMAKSRFVNGIQIKAKYLPPDYQAYLELKNMPHYSPQQKDSIMNLYRNSVAFMLTLQPDERKKEGERIDTRAVSNYSEYAQRIYDLNFQFAEYVRLDAGGREYKPVLSSMDNVYGLSKGRSIILVFVPDDKADRTLYTEKKMDLVYEDELFELGTNHFVFSREDFDQLPHLQF